MSVSASGSVAAADAGALRKYLVVQAIGGAAFNFVLNGAIAWLMFGHAAAQPIWALGPCVGSDAIGTSFFLPLITSLVLGAIVRRHVRGGHVSTQKLTGVFAKFPRGSLGRGALIGLACALTVGPASAFALQGLGFATLDGVQMAAFKAVDTFVLAGLVSPLIAYLALDDRNG